MKRGKRILAAVMAVILGLSGLQFSASEAEASERTNLALNKTVYFSSEEGRSTNGADTHAKNAVDGNRKSYWAAQTKDASGSWDAKYPEWLCVDLGESYEIDAIDLELESKNGQRTYDYKLYASEETVPVSGEAEIPDGFTMILEKKGNTSSGVQPTFSPENVTARYILVEILSCNQYNTTQKWQAASIYELAVYGKENENGGENQEETNPPGDDDMSETVTIPIQTASGRDEKYAVELDGTWQFGGRAADEKTALGADYSAWTSVSLPHTWNALDGEDGGTYDRTVYWYHKDFSVPDGWDGREVYVEFLGSNTKTDVYVNGQKVGDTHKGGYTAFRYCITPYLKAGNNVLDVRVDNRYDTEIAPISGDFNMYGGLYRRVYLVGVSPVHIDLENNGSSGLLLKTGNMRSKTRPADLGTFTASTALCNSADTEQTVTVRTSVKGENAPAPVEQTVTIPAGGRVAYEQLCTVTNPVLWEGVKYDKGADKSKAGYRYEVTVEVLADGKVVDAVTEKIGFRYFWIDASADGDSGEGFFLNGEKYPLRGVNRHSYLATVGSAMTEEQHKADMEIMMDLGINCVRLCHYPQTDYFYDLCDANGIIVWTEIPLVNEIGSAAGFEDNIKKQLTELITQQYNRPSVCFWGIENEIGNGTALFNPLSNAMVAKAKKLLYNLDTLVHELDTTGRYTTQAVNRDYSMNKNDPDLVNKDFESNVGWKSDIVAWNIYPGWYPDDNFYGTFEDVMKRKTALDSRPMGLSEYGWGSNVNQHEAYPELGKNNLTSGGAWHPEEYQNLMNEEALAYINAHDELWGTFYWVMFDFAVDRRNEGSQIALNDKGLVTADRKVKKDSYYLYKANWNTGDSFTYITSRRWTEREASETYVKVYSNCDSVELFVNGTSLGMMEAQGNGVFMMEDVTLAIGANEIRTVGTNASEQTVYEDTCTWTRAISSTAELKSDVFAVDNGKKTVTVDKAVTYGEFTDGVKGVNGAKYHIFDGDREVKEADEAVLPGMVIRVIAEDAVSYAVYTIKSSNICAGKKVTATSSEKGNDPEHAVDGDSSTRWVAVNGTYPQSLTVDLGETYILGNLTLDWEVKAGTRSYRYYVEVSEDGTTYEEVINRRENKQVGVIKDYMRQKKARYIRVTAVGCNEAGWATIYEMVADGYRLTSERYHVDDDRHLIIVDQMPEGGIAEGDFTNNLTLAGNCTMKVTLSSGWVHEGNTVEIYDSSNSLFAVYTICTNGTKDDYSDPTKEINLALNKNIVCSSEEGVGSDGNLTIAENAVDGDAGSRWTANVKNASGEWDAKYPEWICIDLGAVYELDTVKLLLEGKANRTYEYNIYGSVDTLPTAGEREIPEGFVKLYATDGNKQVGQQSAVSLDKTKVRYLLVEITSCSAYNSAAKYVGASIYELEVYGTLAPLDKPESGESDKKTGWIFENGSWSYCDENGKPVAGWQMIDKKWYFFDSEGVMKTGWVADGGKWYYMKSNGAMATGWQEVDGKWYYMKLNGSMATGWQKVDGKWYYMKLNGSMATGWQKLDGKWYYMKLNGSMATGWQKLDGKWYYMKLNGSMATGWLKVGDKWYYFDNSGVMAVGSKVIGGKTYSFDATGAWIEK